MRWNSPTTILAVTFAVAIAAPARAQDRTAGRMETRLAAVESDVRGLDEMSVQVRGLERRMAVLERASPEEGCGCAAIDERLEEIETTLENLRTFVLETRSSLLAQINSLRADVRIVEQAVAAHH